MSRPYCEKCQFPVRTCICPFVNAVDKISYAGQIHVLQHASEAGHAKNSLRLVQQLLPDIRVWTGESADDFTSLSNQIAANPADWACFYPNVNSVENNEKQPPLPQTRLIFIDATWRKARKIWHLNTWLHNLALYHLSPDYVAQYQIRKNHKAHQLSTLEAIAHAIHWQTDSTPLLTLFEKFQQQTTQFYL